MSQKSDTISRQEAIDALKGLPTWWADEGGYYGGAQPPMEALLEPEDAISALENLPSAQPERPTGKWIATTSSQEGQITWRDYKCSNCSHHREKPMNFCEVCGAKMER